MSSGRTTPANSAPVTMPRSAVLRREPLVSAQPGWEATAMLWAPDARHRCAVTE
ncbi:hypothetical protein AB0K66_18390 [Streptomyces werraensis]|uniref:hypothetical protein n=1 Tax=Streptomyces werraensis TaxID=68284 RepID=UPI003425CAE8